MSVWVANIFSNGIDLFVKFIEKYFFYSKRKHFLFMCPLINSTNPRIVLAYISSSHYENKTETKLNEQQKHKQNEKPSLTRNRTQQWKQLPLISSWCQTTPRVAIVTLPKQLIRLIVWFRENFDRGSQKYAPHTERTDSRTNEKHLLLNDIWNKSHLKCNICLKISRLLSIIWVISCQCVIYLLWWTSKKICL